jgi:putative pyoverdin transport system ATP-binding/permease protein
MKLISFFLRSSKSIGYSKALIAIVIVAGIVGGVANTIVLALINSALSRNVSSARNLVWSFIGVCVLLATSKAVSQIMLTRFATGTAYNMRLQLSRQILSSPVRHLELIGSSKLLASLTEDIPAITNTLTNLPNLCINLVIVLGCFVYMGYLSLTLLLVVLGTVVVGGLSYHLLGQKAEHYFTLARKSWDDLLKNFTSMIEGNKELKLHQRRREEFFSQNVDAVAAGLARHRAAATTHYAIAENWGEMLIFFIIGTLIFFLATFGGGNTEVLTGYVIAILYMMNPLQFILNTFPLISQAEIAIDQVEKLRATLAIEIKEDDSHALATSNLPWESAELRHVTHTYHRERENTSFTLGPIDFKLTPGEMVFITGGNGSGKTTLAKLLTGLYAPETGEIRLDGAPVTDRNRDYYRQHFAAVFSDFHLFDALLGLGSAELDTQAQEYLTLLQLNHKVEVKDGLLSTTNLSQGQRKRLALLTAYLEDRPIYVFDEWAADQDPLFKDVFYFQLLPELKARGKTVVVISHDDRYYHVADRLIKLDYGKLDFDKLVSAKDAQLEVPLAVR